MLRKEVLICILGTAAMTGCHRGEHERRIVVEEKYVHQYGIELKANEWETRGRSGQVIATLDNGVVVSKEYLEGTLDGETTYTYPHSSIVEHVDTYEDGVLWKTVYNDTTGNPRHEICFQEGNERAEREFYDSLAPKFKETYRGDFLLNGEYFTQDSKVESKIENGSGLKILRSSEGELQGEALFEEGKLARETTFYPNGNPKEVIPYKNDVVEGLKRTYLINGEPNTIEEWSSNFQNGITTLFRNGNKYAEIPFVNGKKEGVEVRYRDGDTVTEEITWEKNKMHGPYHTYFGSSKKTEWYLQGQRVSKAFFEQQK